MTNKIVSISGAQGSGKSTTIDTLHETHGYTVDSFSTPRYVQAKLGYKTLAEVLAQPISKIKHYQLHILEAKLDRDLNNKKIEGAGGAVIVERNFADIYTFALQWAIQSNDEDFINWVNEEYLPTCVSYQKEVDYFSILLKPLKTFQVDPRRADEDSRFIIHERMFKTIAEDMEVRDEHRMSNWKMIGFESLDERVKNIHQDIQFRLFPESEEANRILTEGLSSLIITK